MGFFGAFPYFLCTFAQIELLTHAYDAELTEGLAPCELIADALTYHNTESVVVGYVVKGNSLTPDPSIPANAPTRSLSTGEGSEKQSATIEALLTALHATFPKATLIDVERWNRYTANIRELKESRWAKMFE